MVGRSRLEVIGSGLILCWFWLHCVLYSMQGMDFLVELLDSNGYSQHVGSQQQRRVTQAHSHSDPLGVWDTHYLLHAKMLRGTTKILKHSALS